MVVLGASVCAGEKYHWEYSYLSDMYLQIFQIYQSYLRKLRETSIICNFRPELVLEYSLMQPAK